MIVKPLRKIFSLLALTIILFPASVWGEQRNYYYESIIYDINVRKDTIVTVREEQTYNFFGTYHLGWRSIPYKDIGSVSDVVVYDAETGKALTYSPKKLDKYSPSSWGSYTYYKSGNTMNIEWYFSATDELKTWIIEYDVHGAISFLDDKDELYWNLFTDYSVPVNSVIAYVTIPENTNPVSSMSAMLYATRPIPSLYIAESSRMFHFETREVFPNESVTIAAGWEKGIINRSLYWGGLAMTNATLLISIFIVLSTLLLGYIYWYQTERKNKGRGIIIPQYEPPQKLPPAMAEVLVKERITLKAWSATVIDLAVRGYLKITEEELTNLHKFLKGFVIFFVVLTPAVMGIVALTSLFTVSRNSGILFILLALFLIVFLGLVFKKRFDNQESSIVPKDYLIEWVKEPDASLQDYENKFMYVIGRRFSTKEMKINMAAARALYKALQQLKHEVILETEKDTGAFEKTIVHESKRNKVFYFIFLIFNYSVALVFQFMFSVGSLEIILIVLVLSLALAFLFFKFEGRLSHEGTIKREEWLGFKLYLETAERYRMQNLTPETFEKYLPYAIIFNIEKKWGKAFDSLHMNPPTWYAGSHIGSGSFGGSSSFSASVFSASFASSFSSAFASSGGASGGGGGAGGGGGGGGGGAS